MHWTTLSSLTWSKSRIFDPVLCSMIGPLNERDTFRLSESHDADLVMWGRLATWRMLFTYISLRNITFRISFLDNPRIPNATYPGTYKHHVSLTYLSSLPILAVVYRFVYLPTANLPIYHNLPISTDFFADLPNFNFFLPIFLLFHVNYALTNVIFMYLWWKVWKIFCI